MECALEAPHIRTSKDINTEVIHGDAQAILSTPNPP